MRWILLLVVLGLFGCGYRFVDENPEAKIVEYENNIINSGRGWFGDVPKGLRPMLMVGGKLFRWTGMSKEHHGLENGDVYTVADSSSFLPEGYVSVGEISSITEEVPLEELQLRAAFKATGTVFVNEDIPEVVYALMSTSWFTDYYIRFVSDDLHDNECISYQGKQYRFNIDPYICKKLKELPQGCILIGTLNYIGSDIIPINDLETNCISDSYSKYLDGREVYADPNDLTVIYVYEHQYWAKGDKPAWVTCPLWEE